tara:strand:+ start:342 stop:557 length:216 start_codon:yes stop_codon:yes gene_type:complete
MFKELKLKDMIYQNHILYVILNLSKTQILIQNNKIKLKIQNKIINKINQFNMNNKVKNKMNKNLKKIINLY